MHIHEFIDFTNGVFIVHKNKVLLIHHRELNAWLPIGGHIELNEDTDDALFREIKEECGLDRDDIEIMSDKPPTCDDAKFLLVPQYMNIHKVNKKHKHITLVYFVKSKKETVALRENEHYAIKWFSQEELKKQKLYNNVRLLAEEALRVCREK